MRPAKSMPKKGKIKTSGKYKGKSNKLGAGGRFAQLKAKLGARKGKKAVKNPGALAAFIGRKKYGAKKFAAMGAKARAKKA